MTPRTFKKIEYANYIAFSLVALFLIFVLSYAIVEKDKYISTNKLQQYSNNVKIPTPFGCAYTADTQEQFIKKESFLYQIGVKKEPYVLICK